MNEEEKITEEAKARINSQLTNINLEFFMLDNHEEEKKHTQVLGHYLSPMQTDATVNSRI